MHSWDNWPYKERDPRMDHPNFYWLQEDYVREAAEGEPWSWTVFRPPAIIGHAIGANMSALDAIAANLAIAKETGEPMYFWGAAQTLATAVDARLLARAFVWATSAPKARNQLFNIENGGARPPERLARSPCTFPLAASLRLPLSGRVGLSADVFLWENVYREICAACGVEFGGVRSGDGSYREVLPRHAQLWEEMVAKYGLRVSSDLMELMGQSLEFVDGMGHSSRRPVR